MGLTHRVWTVKRAPRFLPGPQQPVEHEAPLQLHILTTATTLQNVGAQTQGRVAAQCAQCANLTANVITTNSAKPISPPAENLR